MCRCLLLLLAFFAPAIKLGLFRPNFYRQFGSVVGLLCLVLYVGWKKMSCSPLAVLFDRGCGRALLLNCLLTLCFFIPGVIHAFMLILGDGHRRDEHDHHHHHHTEEVIVTRNVQYVGQPVVVEQVHGHHHHHHYDEVVIGQPVIVGQQVLQPQYLGQGVAAYQPPPVYPNIK